MDTRSIITQMGGLPECGGDCGCRGRYDLDEEVDDLVSDGCRELVGCGCAAITALVVTALVVALVIRRFVR